MSEAYGLYIGGYYIENNNYDQYVAKLNNDKFEQIKDGVIINIPSHGGGGIEANIITMAIFNGELYIGGYYQDKKIGVEHENQFVAKLNNDTKSFQQITAGLIENKSYLSRISTMTIFNNELYIGGFYSVVTSLTQYVAKLNNNTFQQITDGLIENTDTDTEINVMTIVNGELYIGGYYTDSNTSYNQYVAKLNNNKFEQIKGGLMEKKSDTQINAMTIVNGELYIGGYYTDSNTSYNQYVAKLNNNKFEQIKGGLMEKNE